MAKKFNLSRSAVTRHAKKCLSLDSGKTAPFVGLATVFGLSEDDFLTSLEREQERFEAALKKNTDGLAEALTKAYGRLDDDLAKFYGSNR